MLQNDNWSADSLPESTFAPRKLVCGGPHWWGESGGVNIFMLYYLVLNSLGDCFIG